MSAPASGPKSQIGSLLLDPTRERSPGGRASRVDCLHAAGSYFCEHGHYLHAGTVMSIEHAARGATAQPHGSHAGCGGGGGVRITFTAAARSRQARLFTRRRIQHRATCRIAERSDAVFVRCVIYYSSGESVESTTAWVSRAFS